MKKLLAMFVFGVLAAGLVAAKDSPEIKWDTQVKYEGRWDYSRDETGTKGNTYTHKFEPRIRFSYGRWQMHLEWESVLGTHDFVSGGATGPEIGRIEWETRWKESWGRFTLDLRNETEFRFTEDHGDPPSTYINYWAQFTPQFRYTWDSGLTAYINIEWDYISRGEWTAEIRTVPSVAYRSGPHYIELETTQLVYSGDSNEWYPGVWDFNLEYQYTVWRNGPASLDLGLIPKLRIDSSRPPTEYRLRVDSEITYKYRF